MKQLYKSDKYRNSRGGYSRLYKIHCKKCNTEILIYQKDGPGILERIYLDRIIKPDVLNKLTTIPLAKIPDLKCKNCQSWLATPYIYKKEKRKAYKLFVGAIVKKPL